jgi:dipeptidyl aminopeptidase/acylaminoacyl peptidase
MGKRTGSVGHSLLGLLLAGVLAGCAGGGEEAPPELAFGIGNGAGMAIQAVDSEGNLGNITEPLPSAVSTAPAWSPDGKRLAFAALAPDAGGGEIYVHEEDGGPRKVGNGLDAEWAPDGRLLVSNGASISVVDADGDEERLLAKGTEPALSPDGRRVAFVRSEGSALAEVPFEGGPVEAFPPVPGGWVVIDHEWLPDGQALAVLRQNERNGRTVLESVRLDTGARRTLGRGTFEEFALSPTGVPAYANEAGGLVVGPSLLAVPELGQSLPFGLAWSPDGRELAFYGGEQDEIGTNYVSIFVLNLEAAAVRRVARVQGTAADIAWYPSQV